MLATQAALHGQAQSLARSEAGYSGLLGWAAFDYASPDGLDPESVKCAGVADGFRVPKPGSAIYQSQVDPNVRPVIVPVFFWEPAGIVPASRPDRDDRQQLRAAGDLHRRRARDDRAAREEAAEVPDLAYPPFLVELPAGHAQRDAGTPDRGLRRQPAGDGAAHVVEPGR